MNLTEINDLLIQNSENISNQYLFEDFDDSYRGFRDESRFWFQRVLVPIIALIGVFGNCVTIVIMTRKGMQSSTNSYLAALATFDGLYLVFTFLLSLSHYPNAKHVNYYYCWLLWPIFLMICDVSSNTSVWLTVTFTIERYFVVCNPIKGKMLCTPSRARKIILIISLVCFLITFPTVFEWKITTNLNQNNNETYIQVIHSDLGLNLLYKKIYYYSTVILFIFLPLIILSVFNIFLIRSVRVSGVKRRTLTSVNAVERDSSKKSLRPKWSETNRQESHITRLLIAIVILFLICQTPTACVLIYAIHDDDSEDIRKQSLIRGLGNIFNFLVAVNSGGNFVLYCLMSKKYRQTFKKTFCLRARLKNQKFNLINLNNEI